MSSHSSGHIMTELSAVGVALEWVIVCDLQDVGVEEPRDYVGQFLSVDGVKKVKHSDSLIIPRVGEQQDLEVGSLHVFVEARLAEIHAAESLGIDVKASLRP